VDIRPVAYVIGARRGPDALVAAVPPNSLAAHLPAPCPVMSLPSYEDDGYDDSPGMDRERNTARPGQPVTADSTGVVTTSRPRGGTAGSLIPVSPPRAGAELG